LLLVLSSWPNKLISGLKAIVFEFVETEPKQKLSRTKSKKML